MTMTRPDWPASSVSAETVRPFLSPSSTLADLVLYDCQVAADTPGLEVGKLFDENPLLPGIILHEANQFLGMVSRRRFLELLSRRYGLEIFSKRPLRVLHQFAQVRTLILPGDTPIAVATQQSLQRSPELLYEPIVVELDPTTYRIVDTHHLLLAQARIHELTTQLLHQQRQVQLMQTKQLANLGQRMAEITDEMLSPINFLWGHLECVSDYGHRLTAGLAAYAAHAQPHPALQQHLQELDLSFVIQDLPNVLSHLHLSVDRVKTIIQALRACSSLDEQVRQPVDLHSCLENTLLLLNNRLYRDVRVIKHYGDIPSILGSSGQISQVLMNLIVNAIEAIAARTESFTDPTWRPCLEINTETIQHQDQPWIQVQIRDNGIGIPEEMYAKVFEPFFTTKVPRQETGLGLSISRHIVTETYGGELTLQSQPDLGCCATIRLPIRSALPVLQTTEVEL